MGSSIESMVLFFENLDYIVVPWQFVLEFWCDGIDEQVFQNSINKVNSSNVISFVLSKSANEEAVKFEGDIFGVHERTVTLFDRIANYQDITQINVCYTSGEVKKYEAVWEDDENEYRNKFQRTSITEDGALCVDIDI